jgi:hypothetical protein
LADYPLDPSRDFDASIAEISRRVSISITTRRNLERALSEIDQAARAALLDRCGDELRDFDPSGPLKFADFVVWAFRKLLIAEWLELDHSPPLNILDIGMGSGSFAMVARSMGHRVVGTDVPDPWYDELCEIAGARRVIAPVESGRPYRIEGCPFDLITIMQPTFHRSRKGGNVRQYWSINEWAAFLTDVTAMLSSRGRIFLVMPLDKLDDGDRRYSQVLAWAQSRGATLDRPFPQSPVSYVCFTHPTAETFRI